jgi:outer membrane protein assembly factor BamB
MMRENKATLKRSSLRVSTLSLTTLSSLFLSVNSSLASSFNLTQTFFNPTPAPGEQFGWSAAISGDKVVIGTRNDSTQESDNGAVYVFDATTGKLQQTFFDPTSSDRSIAFGSSVAISGNKIVTGKTESLRGGDTGPFRGGVAYLFDATAGNLLQTFLNPAIEKSGLFAFGRQVAIDGSNVLISNSDEDNSGETQTGAAYLFDATTGNLLQTFLNPNPAGASQFGFSTAISGNKVLIGTPFDDTGAIDSGAAYLFDATSGKLLQTFLNPSPTYFGLFGRSVAINGDKILINALNNINSDAGRTSIGTVYLFDAITGNLLQTFVHPTPNENDQFGYSIGIDGNNVLIGTYTNGIAHLFDATTGNLLQTFLNPTSAENEFFGSVVAISGDNLLISASLLYDGTEAPNSGAVYLFQRTSELRSVPESNMMSLFSAVFIGFAVMKQRRATISAMPMSKNKQL